MTTNAIHPGARIGHVHLKVADLQRALDFYCGVLGLELQAKIGDSAAFISAGGYHHHIGLNTWESLGGKPPAAGTTGLYHTALLYPTQAALGDALKRLIVAKFRWMARRTTASPRRYTCATRTRMVWSCIGIDRRRSGLERRAASLRCIPARWI